MPRPAAELSNASTPTSLALTNVVMCVSYETVAAGRIRHACRRSGTAPLAIQNVTVIDGIGSPPKSGMTVVIANGRIQCGPSESCSGH